MKPNKLLRSVGDGKEKTGVRAANVFRLVAHSGKSNHLIRGIYAARYCAGHHDWRGIGIMLLALWMFRKNNGFKSKK